MAWLVYFLLLFNLGCFIFVGFVAGCMEFIAEKHQREGSFAKRSPIEVEECVELCVQTDICFAVNYFRLNATCQFLNRTMPESKLVKAAKCLYKSVRGPPKESIDKDPCYQKLCPWDQICIHNTTTNLAECYPLCKTPPVKSGAIYETAEVELGNNFTYRCQDGLFGKQNQNPTVTCLQDGNWTPTNFTCACKTPPVKSGAINETAEVEIGENYTYKCKEGLFGKQNQNPTLTCLQDGNWTSTNFTCVCKTPIAKSGTINVTEEVELGQNYTYRCQDGLIGKRFQNPTVMCLPGGDWTTTHFTCVCKTPIAKSGTINVTEEVELGQDYTYRCQDGLIGKIFQNPSVTCLPGGNFTTTNFSCVCKTPPVKSGAIIEIEEVELGQNYTYKCQDGLFGKQNQSPITTCLQDGNWTQTNFTCVCKTPIAKSGTINETAEVEIGMNYTYRCQDGLIGKRDQNPTITCLPGGNWTTTNFTCVCKAPAKSGAINQTTEVEIGQNYTYRCEINLFEKGDQNPTVTCLHDGNWTPTNFICVKQNWTQDTIYPNNIHKSEVISNSTGIDLFACMQECDKKPTNCMSFFYDNHSSLCVLSSSFQRGLPEGFQHSDGLVYYTPPSTSCDLQYRNVTLDGSYFCIKYHDELKSFNEAMKACESEKAKLLVVTNKTQITDLSKIWPNLFCAFIGVSDESVEGHWVSWNGKNVTLDWIQGEPNDIGGEEDCACIADLADKVGTYDVGCKTLRSFLCHKNLL